MKKITTGEINKFIESKGGSVSIPELAEFLSQTDFVTISSSKNSHPQKPLPAHPNQKSPKFLDDKDNPMDVELLEKFIHAVQTDEHGELSNALFQKQCADNGIQFEFLETKVILNNGTIMTGKVVSTKDDRFIYINEYMSRWVPSTKTEQIDNGIRQNEINL